MKGSDDVYQVVHMPSSLIVNHNVTLSHMPSSNPQIPNTACPVLNCFLSKLSHGKNHISIHTSLLEPYWNFGNSLSASTCSLFWIILSTLVVTDFKATFLRNWNHDGIHPLLWNIFLFSNNFNELHYQPHDIPTPASHL